MSSAAQYDSYLQPVEGAYTQLEQLLALRFAARELQLTPRRRSQSTQAGSARTRFRGRGMEFEEVRLYQAGDDIRSIDWRVTARTQVAHTKLYREERERPVMLMLDQCNSMFFGSRHCFKSVLAAHTAVLLGWAALAQNDRVGGLVFSDRSERDIRPKRSRHTLLTLLQVIQQFNSELQTPLTPAAAVPLQQRLADLRRISKPGSAVMIISDLQGWNDGCAEQLHHLGRHNDVSLLWVSDPLEQQLPQQMTLTVTNGVERRALNTADANLAGQFHQDFLQRQASLQQAASEAGAWLLPLTTAQSPLAQLLPLFGKRPCRR